MRRDGGHVQYAVPYESDRLDWQAGATMPVDDVRIAAVGDGLVSKAANAAVTECEAGGERVVGAALGALYRDSRDVYLAVCPRRPRRRRSGARCRKQLARADVRVRGCARNRDYARILPLGA